MTEAQRQRIAEIEKWHIAAMPQAVVRGGHIDESAKIHHACSELGFLLALVKEQAAELNKFSPRSGRRGLLQQKTDLINELSRVRGERDRQRIRAELAEEEIERLKGAAPNPAAAPSSDRQQTHLS